MNRKVSITLLLVLAVIVSACAPAATPAPTSAPAAPPPTTAPSAPGATEPPAPTEPSAPTAPEPKDKETFTFLTFGDPQSLDPHIEYDSASSATLRNIYEGLITFEGADPQVIKPQLAKAIPEPVTNADGSLSYTWEIIDGVKFHNGSDLEPHDVAYSYWRSMLLGDGSLTPSFLMLEAFLGIDDATQLIDPEGGLIGDPDALKAADPAAIVAACETIKAAVVADDAAGTVTTNLVAPWGPFLATLAGGAMAGEWAAVVDQEWQVENGDWDGDCSTWPNFYGIPAESGLFLNITNGTGPYMLDSWIPEEEIVMVAFPGYREGEASIKRVVRKNITEFGTRFAALQAGDADTIDLGSTADRTQMDTLVRDECDRITGECTTINPDGILRAYAKLPSLGRTDIYFNFNVGEDNPYVGSGQLDGEGVPPDFFNDVHVRRAFNYCFDYDTYINDVQLGDAVKSEALTLPGQPGYEGSPHFNFDLAKCEEEFKASTLTAEDGTSLWDTGFYMQILYNAGNTQRQTISEILAAGLQQVNPSFFVSSVALPWPTYLRSLNAKQLPMSTSGWGEDIDDPHNWYVPFLTGFYAARFNLPQELQDKYRPLIDQGVREVDQAKRAEIYSQLNQMVYEDAPLIILSVQNGKRYEPLYLQGWWNGLSQNPMVYPDLYYFELSKD